MLRAIGETPIEPWYIGQTFSDTNHDVNGNNDTEGTPDFREDRNLRTSVWIVKATACIIAKIYFSEPKNSAENLNIAETDKDTLETGYSKGEALIEVDEIPHQRQATLRRSRIHNNTTVGNS